MGSIKDRKVKEFIKKVKNKFKVEKLLLFGSRARNDYLNNSDYDFLIVSRDFEKVHFLDRISLVLKKTMPDFGIDVLCYTPKEFEKKS
ncbi:MAG: nucleotidyltransferase domain-containing protein, partial [archaeon]